MGFGVPIGLRGVPDGVWGPYRIKGVPDGVWGPHRIKRGPVRGLGSP